MTLWREAFTLATETGNAEGLFQPPAHLASHWPGVERQRKPGPSWVSRRGWEGGGFCNVEGLEAMLRRLPSEER